MRNQYSPRKEFWNKRKVKIRSDILVNPYVIKAVGNVRKKKILDIGCGDGSLTEYFAKRGADITGIDSSKELIDSIKDKQGKWKSFIFLSK